MAKLGRNEPCPCGSGKKYKHCCLGKHETAMRAAESYETPEEADIDAAKLREQYDRLPEITKTEAIAGSSKAFIKFTDIYVTDKLLDFTDLSELQFALRAIFLRLLMQMQSLSMLVSPSNYQASTMISRNMLELCIDLTVLANNPDMLGKYLTFPEVERFNYAKKLMNFHNEHSNLVEPAEYELAVKFASDPERIRHIDELRTQHWGLTRKDTPVNPQSWSNLSMADLAIKAGFEFHELYRKMYQPSSWQVHSGAAGHLDLPAAAHLNFHVSAHLDGQNIFERAIRKADAVFHLGDCQGYFDRDLNRVKWQFGVELSNAMSDAEKSAVEM